MATRDIFFVFLKKDLLFLKNTAFFVVQKFGFEIREYLDKWIREYLDKRRCSIRIIFKLKKSEKEIKYKRRGL